MSQFEKNTLVVVSHYNARGKEDLQALLNQLEPLAPHILVVINEDHHQGPAEFLPGMPTPCLRRTNTGMNIGGWNEAFQQRPDFEHYIFLQDECRIVANDFLSVYEDRLKEPGIDMIGESLNPQWNRPWAEIASSNLNYPVHITPGSPAMMRTAFYLACLNNWGISPGTTGAHLRSLVWAFRHDTLERIKAFPIGRNKEECIAAEIATSKSVEQLGGRIAQVGSAPFQYIQHKEWRADGSHKQS